MKLKGLFALVIVGLTWATTAQADIVLNTGQGDICDKVTGHWIGGGKAVELGLITCVYTGNGDISSSKPGELNINNLNLDLQPKESSFICPSHETLSFSGECHNGKIIIHTDLAKLDGELVDEGNRANVSGTVTFTVPVIGKITPNVDMTLHKG